MASLPIASSTTNSRGVRREAIMQSLMEDIFHGRIVAGQHLVTQELAERFGVSHTPVREALIGLGGLGVLTLQPNRGAQVRRISAREVRDVCRVRCVLECEAVRGACGRLATKPLQNLRSELQKLQKDEGRESAKVVARARALDNELHDMLAHAADNQFLVGELNRLKLLFRAYRDAAWDYDQHRHGCSRIASETREHLAIVEALLANDRRAARLAMARHITSGMKYWARAVPATVDHRATRDSSQPLSIQPEVSR